MPNAFKHEVWISSSGLCLVFWQLACYKVQVCKCISVRPSYPPSRSVLAWTPLMFLIMLAFWPIFPRSMLAAIWVAACFCITDMYGKASRLGLCLFSARAFPGLSLKKTVYYAHIFCESKIVVKKLCLDKLWIFSSLPNIWVEMTLDMVVTCCDLRFSSNIGLSVDSTRQWHRKNPALSGDRFLANHNDLEKHRFCSGCQQIQRSLKPVPSNDPGRKKVWQKHFESRQIGPTWRKTWRFRSKALPTRPGPGPRRTAPRGAGRRRKSWMRSRRSCAWRRRKPKWPRKKPSKSWKWRKPKKRREKKPTHFLLFVIGKQTKLQNIIFVSWGKAGQKQLLYFGLGRSMMYY